MTHFLGAGTIASDIVRKETRLGVLATFRLRSGQKGHGQVWIDVEAWGHLAGTTHQHGHLDRAVIVAGRLTHKTWHDRSTGEARHRYVITAADIDLLPGCDGIDLTNSMVAAGIVDSEPTSRAAGTGIVTEFQLATGRARSKTGRLWIAVEHWHREPIEIRKRDRVALTGRLAFGRDSGDRARYYIDTESIAPPSSKPPAGTAR